jgi:hypothetical protein
MLSEAKKPSTKQRIVINIALRGPKSKRNAAICQLSLAAPVDQSLYQFRSFF